MRQLIVFQGCKKVTLMVTLTFLLAMGNFTMSAPGSAHAATSIHSTTHCQIVIDKLHPGETTSHIRSQKCVTGNQALAAPPSSILLTIWYEDADYHGSYATIFGAEGGCDSAGYAINNTNLFWNDGRGAEWGYLLSSYKVYDNCYWTSAYTDYSLTGTCSVFAGDVHYVGDNLNDQVFSMHLSSSTSTEFAYC